ncbi:MAG: methanogenesis marker 2 protein [Methanosarcinaceae archaeon]|nr:methanogenesis marker 2 protein [Methanosarcinaceae archaeon]
MNLNIDRLKSVLPQKSSKDSCESFLKDICGFIKNFDGILRKKPIADISKSFERVRLSYENCVEDIGDDAAIIDINTDKYLLLAADGIWGRLIEKSPWWAGYASVVSNINDIYAMGGKPLAMVDIVSSGSEDSIKQIMEGMAEGVFKFNVPVVGGHTHPDPGPNSVSVAILGIVDKKCVIKSSTANIGDNVIAAFDLDGRTGPNSVYSWENTSHKTPESLKKLYGSVEILGEKKLVTAGKDISNPGILGTLGMLCEVSNCGATVEIEKIPYPKNSEISVENWLVIHPGTGFIFTAKPENTKECIKILNEAGFEAEKIGKITENKKLNLFYNDCTETLFDFNKESITGL